MTTPTTETTQRVALSFDKHGDDREVSLLNYIFTHSTENSPTSVLSAFDTFARQHQWLMNVGDEKGPICDEIIQRENPKVMVELGAYLGYSA
ncbi:hypothetical protein HK102_011205, partial [Quaeritorhiza haematococci]